MNPETRLIQIKVLIAKVIYAIRYLIGAVAVVCGGQKWRRQSVDAHDVVGSIENGFGWESGARQNPNDFSVDQVEKARAGKHDRVGVVIGVEDVIVCFGLDWNYKF